MKKWLCSLVLALLPLMAQAADVSFNGARPAIIIDVRTAEEFAAGHIDGAVNIPYEQIAQGIKAQAGIKKDSAILLYCRSGRRSGIAKATLEQNGYSRVTDGGGMTALAPQLKACTAKTC